mmetsp:Transcript_2945/g.3451  ORF Transcript_2945/g.3451 Transcript_2945/m.3451 type:complete len:374 (+) Transcript_2945:17-1138(+)
MPASVAKLSDEPTRRQQRQRCDQRQHIVSQTNARLRRPSIAASLALDAVSSNPAARLSRNKDFEDSHQFRVVIGIGPGRSGTKSLNELFSSQPHCVRSEHEMIVPRQLENRNGKGSWGSDRRLEWDPPRQARGTKDRTEDQAASWRVARLLEQRRVFAGWVNERLEKTDGNKDEQVKPRKFGAKGWRDHNEQKKSNGRDQDSANFNGDWCDTNNSGQERPVVRVAAVSSSALAYAHEYLALDPSTRIAVVTRPSEEVISSFMTKTKGRNHWQRHDEENSTKDKTWDNQFPYMTDDECMANPSSKSKAGKAAAVSAYCELYESVTEDLARRYPNNIRIFNMSEILNDMTQQDSMLRWCGFDDPLFDTSIRLNKS